MAIELAEVDEQGTASNPRLWLEAVATYASKHGKRDLWEDPQRRRALLAAMAKAGLGNYQWKPETEQKVALDVAIETALFFMG